MSESATQLTLLELPSPELEVVVRPFVRVEAVAYQEVALPLVFEEATWDVSDAANEASDELGLETAASIRELNESQTDALRLHALDFTQALFDRFSTDALVGAACNETAASSADTETSLGQVALFTNIGIGEVLIRDNETELAIRDLVEFPDDVFETFDAFYDVFGEDGIGAEPFDLSMSAVELRSKLEDIFGDKDYQPFNVVDQNATAIAEAFLDQTFAAAPRSTSYDHEPIYAQARQTVFDALQTEFLATQTQPMQQGLAAAYDLEGVDA